MTAYGQRGQQVAPSAHRRCDNDEVRHYSVIKVQGGRFFVINMGDFSMLKLIYSGSKWSVF
jgi:hypothetical protein